MGDDDKEYKKLCAKRRMNGFALLALGGFFGFIANLVARQSSSEEAQGAYAVPIIVIVIAFYYLLSKPTARS